LVDCPAGDVPVPDVVDDGPVGAGTRIVAVGASDAVAAEPAARSDVVASEPLAGVLPARATGTSACSSTTGSPSPDPGASGRGDGRGTDAGPFPVSSFRPEPVSFAVAFAATEVPASPRAAVVPALPASAVTAACSPVATALRPSWSPRSSSSGVLVVSFTR
jgi:hypothetical protein